MGYNDKIDALLAEAWSKRNREHYGIAKSIVDEAFKICKKDDHDSLGKIFHIYRQISFDQQSFDKALGYNISSVGHYKKTKNQSKIAHSIRHLADVQFQLGQLNKAEKNYQLSINLYRTIGSSHLDLANALRGFAILLEKKDKLREAKKVWEETKELYQKCDIVAGIQEADDKLENLK